MASYAREPRAYELMAILLPELAEEDLTGAQERVSKYITDASGAIKETLTDSPWGRRRLAYTIRFNGTDYRDGYYVIWHFDLEPSRMTEIERELKLDVRVMRYLVVHDDPKWGSPNEGNQPPPGEEERDGPRRSDSSRGPRRPESERRPMGERRPEGERRPQPAVATAPAVTDSPVVAHPPVVADTPVAEPAAVDTAVTTTDQSMAMTGGDGGETPVTGIGAPDQDAEVTPDPMGTAAPVEGATGTEIASVVEDTTGAAVVAPVDAPSDAPSDEPSDATTDEEK